MYTYSRPCTAKLHKSLSYVLIANKIWPLIGLHSPFPNPKLLKGRIYVKKEKTTASLLLKIQLGWSNCSYHGYYVNRNDFKKFAFQFFLTVYAMYFLAFLRDKSYEDGKARTVNSWKATIHIRVLYRNRIFNSMLTDNMMGSSNDKAVPIAKKGSLGRAEQLYRQAYKTGLS